MAGEAAAGLAGDGTGGIVAAIGVAAPAPRIIREALQDSARLVGDDGNGAEVVLVEIPGGNGLVAVLDVHADAAAGCRQVVGPAYGAAGAGELLGIAQIERGAAGCGLLEALVLGVVGKADGGRAAGDGGRLVVRGIADRQAVAGGHVTLGVVRKGGVDRAATDAGNGMRLGLPGRRIGVGADVGLGGQVADGAVEPAPAKAGAKVFTSGVGDSATVAEVSRLSSS